LDSQPQTGIEVRVSPTLAGSYRNLPNKNVEVNLKLLVNRDQVILEAKKQIRQELRERLKGLQDKVDRLLPLQ
jgi:hypothetical protein